MLVCAMFQLGQLSYKQGRLEEALGYFVHDLQLTRADVGTGHPRVACKFYNDFNIYVFSTYKKKHMRQFHSLNLDYLSLTL